MVIDRFPSVTLAARNGSSRLLLMVYGSWVIELTTNKFRGKNEFFNPKRLRGER
jgi:hypothetical protein